MAQTLTANQRAALAEIAVRDGSFAGGTPKANQALLDALETKGYIDITAQGPRINEAGEDVLRAWLAGVPNAVSDGMSAADTSAFNHAQGYFAR